MKSRNFETEMSPAAWELLKALLEYRNEIVQRVSSNTVQTKDLIPYKKLAERAKVPIIRGIGYPLGQIANWCDAHKPRLPPINALAVNGDTRIPGDGYIPDPAQWWGDVQKCLESHDYPDPASIEC